MGLYVMCGVGAWGCVGTASPSRWHPLHLCSPEMSAGETEAPIEETQGEKAESRANKRPHALKEHSAFFFMILSFLPFFFFLSLKAAVPFSSTFKWLPGKQSKGECKG